MAFMSQCQQRTAGAGLWHSDALAKPDTSCDGLGETRKNTPFLALSLSP